MNESDEPKATAVAAAPLGEEAIEDHYAALQAWTEWARNRDRLNPQSTRNPALEDDSESNTDDEPTSAVDDESNAELSGDVRAESEHDHAPYSQLFTRLGQPR